MPQTKDPPGETCVVGCASSFYGIPENRTCNSNRLLEGSVSWESRVWREEGGKQRKPWCSELVWGLPLGAHFKDLGQYITRPTGCRFFTFHSQQHWSSNDLKLKPSKHVWNWRLRGKEGDGHKGHRHQRSLDQGWILQLWVGLVPRHAQTTRCFARLHLDIHYDHLHHKCQQHPDHHNDIDSCSAWENWENWQQRGGQIRDIRVDAPSWISHDISSQHISS